MQVSANELPSFRAIHCAFSLDLSTTLGLHGDREKSMKRVVRRQKLQRAAVCHCTGVLVFQQKPSATPYWRMWFVACITGRHDRVIGVTRPVYALHQDGTLLALQLNVRQIMKRGTLSVGLKSLGLISLPKGTPNPKRLATVIFIIWGSPS